MSFSLINVFNNFFDTDLQQNKRSLNPYKIQQNFVV